MQSINSSDLTTKHKETSKITIFFGFLFLMYLVFTFYSLLLSRYYPDSQDCMIQYITQHYPFGERYLLIDEQGYGRKHIDCVDCVPIDDRVQSMGLVRGCMYENFRWWEYADFAFCHITNFNHHYFRLYE